MSRVKLLVIGLLAAMSSACTTMPVAVVPTPWALVAVGGFEMSAEGAPLPSATALAIEAHRHAGLVSEADAANAAVVAAR